MNHSLKWPRASALALGVMLVFTQQALAGGPPDQPASKTSRSGAKRVTFGPTAAKGTATVKGSDQSAKRFIVMYRPGTEKNYNAARVQRLIGGAGKALGLRIGRLRRLAIGADVIEVERELNSADIKRLKKELARDPNVKHVSVDAIWTPLGTPNDPLYSQQWDYHSSGGGIAVEGAWDIATGLGTIVAVIDTGITDHPDLNANVIAGYDMISDPIVAGDGDGRDPDAHDVGDSFQGRPSSWHGTHVAGTIAAVTNNGIGMAGIAHHAKIQPVRALGKQGGHQSDVLDAIVWASGGTVPGVPDNTTPADVINLSLGASQPCDPAAQAAVTRAISNGAIVVAAAGNNNTGVRYATPASCDGAIAVAATGPETERAFYSNFGERVTVAAPGGSGLWPMESNILSTLNDGVTGVGNPIYAWYAGTSMATPHVAGVAALMQSAAATPKTPAEIRKILAYTAYDTGLGFPKGCSFDFQCGTGVVNATRAVSVAAGHTPLPPAPPAYPGPTRSIDVLRSGLELTGLSSSNTVPPTEATFNPDDSLWYAIDIPPGAKHLQVKTWGGAGRVGMFVRRGKLPTLGDNDCESGDGATTTFCAVVAPTPGPYFVRLVPLHSGTANGFTGVSLYVSFVDNLWPRNLQAKSLRGKQGVRVTLSWDSGKKQVDVYRNGAYVRTVRNDGTATDSFRATAGGQASYTVCNTDTTECAPSVTTTY